MAPVSINQSPILTPNTMTTVQDNQQPQAVANIVVIGAGWWSQGWHLPQLKRNQHARILAIVDSSPHPQSNLNPNLEPLTVLSEKYNCRIFSSVQELLNDTDLAPNIDGCIVCTPHATHFQVGKLLIDENNKRERPIHILMEKPMTTNVDEAKEMHELVQEYKSSGGKGCFLVNHSANYRTQCQKAREIIRSIGDIRFVTANMASPLSWIFDDAANTGWNEPNHDMLGNGFGWGQCSHLLAWVFHVCGGGGDDGDDSLTTPMEVYCRMNHSDKTGADVAHAATIVCNDNNIVMSMSGTSLLPGNAHSHPPVGKRFHIEIHGTHGALLYCGDDQIPSSGRLELRRSDGSVELPAGDEFYFEDLNQDGDGPNSLQSFIRACNNHEDYYVGADSHLGLKTVQVLDAMYRSHVTKSAASIY